MKKKSVGRYPSISVCIAAYNEEKTIARCLDSVINWVDEIVVVDGTSSDKTVKIVRKYGKKVRVFIRKNPPMFHKNKQEAIDRAQSTWILQLDADEVVTDNLRKEIMGIIKKGRQDDNVGYWIPRMNFFINKPLYKGGQYPDYTIRLYKKGFAHFPCKSVHEQVAVNGSVGYLKHNLYHYPYSSISDYVIKWDRYNQLEAQALYKNNVRPSFLLFIKYICVKPWGWFLSTYIRHKGFQDGVVGFIFSLFSSLRFILIYSKLYEYSHKTKK